MKRQPLYVHIALGVLLAIGIYILAYNVLSSATTYFSRADSVKMTVPNGGFSAKQRVELDSIYANDSLGATMRALMQPQSPK
jgi:hypothetical protein